MKTLVNRLEYRISDQVKQLAELYLSGQITKRQFAEQVCKTGQIQQIARRFQRENKTIDFFEITIKRTASGEKRASLFVSFVSP